MRGIPVVFLLTSLAIGCAPPRPTVVWEGGPQGGEAPEIAALRRQASDELGCAEGAIYLREGFDEERIATGCGQGAIYRRRYQRYVYGHEVVRDRYRRGVIWVARERFRVAQVGR